MKLLTAIWLFLLSISVYAEEAEQPMEKVGMTGILAFLAFCVIGLGIFIYSMRKNAKVMAEKKAVAEKDAAADKNAAGENKPS